MREGVEAEALKAAGLQKLMHAEVRGNVLPNMLPKTADRVVIGGYAKNDIKASCDQV